MHSPSHAAQLPSGSESPALPRRLVLTGFMGSGKSTIGRLLARQLRWRFIDADAAIESAAGTSIARIFAERGEAWFRQLEHDTIRSLASGDQLVLALGGGAIEDERTRSLLLTNLGTRLIHLNVSLDTVLLRCRGSESVRPLLQDKDGLEARYHRRLPLYSLAHLNLAVDQLRPPAVVDAVIAHFGILPPAAPFPCDR